MTAVEVGDIARTEPKRDRWGRYVALDPSGTPISYTRATTVAKAIEDQHNLAMWRCRKVLQGGAMRPDIITSAQAHDADDDRKHYDGLVQKALDAAASDSAASTGTALHRFTEDIDSGRKELVDIPADWRSTLKLYLDTLQQAGVVIDRTLIEQVLLDDTHRVAGTTDRVVTLADGRRVIADLKTSKNITYSTLAMSVQLAIYAHHTATFDYGTGKRGPRLEVDTTTGLIIHLPSQGPEAGTCTLYTVDLTEGYAAYLTALEVRDMRSSSRGWLEVYRPISGGSGGATAVTDWLRGRIAALDGNTPAVSDLIRLWPADVPKPLPDLLDGPQAAALERTLDTVEANHEIAFGAPRPGVEQETRSKTHEHQR